jgi:hypothetical protein
MLDEGYTIEEVDAILGPVIAARAPPPPHRRPRRADTFGTSSPPYENLPNDPQREVSVARLRAEMVSAAGSATRLGRA